MMNASIVINTYNRANSLRETLSSLRFLRGVDFEVLVVNGPSTDSTGQVLSEFGSSIRTAVCLERNLSQSRNIGIALATGDIVAFIDDDAIPDEFWLRDLIAGYDSDDIGGVGGVVYDHTGAVFQYVYSSANRLGDADWNMKEPLGDQAVFPGSPRFPYLQGTNASFRRTLLVALGGFDEHFDYYLDETELCLRVTDAGYKLRQLENGFVYHRFLPSHIRNDARIPTNWYPIIKNKLYFALRHARPDTPLSDVLANALAFADGALQSLEAHARLDRIGTEHIRRFHADSDAAFKEGLRIGLSPAARSKVFTANDISPGEFVPSGISRRCDRPLTICVLAEHFPPFMADSDGRFAWELALGLADAGHSIHVVTRSIDGSTTVDFESGLWVHRVPIRASDVAPPAGLGVRSDHWNQAWCFWKEVQRIDRRHPIDVIDASLWNAPALAGILEQSICTVIRLGYSVLGSRLGKSWWLPSLSEVQIGGLEHIERLTLGLGTAVRFDSAYRARQLSASSPDDFLSTAVVLPGVGPMVLEQAERRQDDNLRVLCAGNVCHDRGVDVLLSAIPRLCETYRNVSFRFVGADNELVAPDTYRSDIFATASGAQRKNVEFAKAIPDGELTQELASCDILVSPAVGEPFTPLLLEAMSFGRPIVATTSGATPEFLRQGIDGLLAIPGDAASLYDCLDRALRDRGLRESLGRSARERYVRLFTRKAYAQRVEDFYRSAIAVQHAEGTKCAPA